ICDTIFDTIALPGIVYIPEPVYRDTGSTKWRRFPVDTFQILSDYFARIAYCDTIQFDSNAIIIITDTISQNLITYRKPQIILFPQIIRETNYIKVNPDVRRNIFLGFTIGRNPKRFSMAPSIIYQSKKRNTYSLSYDVLSGDINVGMYWKIW
ncbi:MAG: hypothetical protein CL661_07110, partial [Bacteroidetes bacterium]|nr:hypothetical protein [Bacteroidota bacterium]